MSDLSGVSVPNDFAVPEGITVSRPFATFSDANLGDAPNEFQATIDWGDGATSGIASISSGGFSGGASPMCRGGEAPPVRYRSG